MAARWLENSLGEGLDWMHKEKAPDIRLRLFLCGIRQRPTLPGDFACLNPAQRAAGKILSGNRNSRAARSFAIPASISLSRPQGALNYGSKYNGCTLA